MYKVNENYLKLPGSYLFSTTAAKTAAYAKAHPDADIIKLGIGDVTLPLSQSVIDALHKAVDEQAHAETFRGYAPDLGYPFLRNLLSEKVYVALHCSVAPDEIFVSDGAKSDCGNIQELFSADARIALCDPVYPVYLDSNVMSGRCGDYDEKTQTWSRVIYLPCMAENHFVPDIPEETPDLIYLCNPSNPTGTSMTRDQLKKWVDYANEKGAVILYDAAYEAYISDSDVPHSIYEIEGAGNCAIEFRSFSKNAGFTGLRLGFTVVPKSLKNGNASLHDMWARRHGTKFNGAPYIVQRAGEAVYSVEGQKETMEQVNYYKRNAATIKKGLADAGYTVFGGVNSPYVWLQVPDRMTSWEFFDRLLDRVRVVGTPGSGFGPSGEGYFRLTGFGSFERTKEAIGRILKDGKCDKI
jgi:LL-diaminopimelate aminotransferase